MRCSAAHRPTFILASQSPRRRDLLQRAGYRFEVIPAPLAEPPTVGSTLAPRQLAESQAYFKAAAVVDHLRPDLPVLGADTVVALDGTIYGKPRDADDAREILAALGAARHQVITGLALLDPSGLRLLASDLTHVTMRAMSPAEMDAYIAGGSWQGKAGAYGIQDEGDRYVEMVEGSWSNVVGLPVEMVPGLFAQLLMRQGE